MEVFKLAGPLHIHSLAQLSGVCLINGSLLENGGIIESSVTVYKSIGVFTATSTHLPVPLQSISILSGRVAEQWAFKQLWTWPIVQLCSIQTQRSVQERWRCMLLDRRQACTYGGGHVRHLAPCERCQARSHCNCCYSQSGAISLH